MLQFWESAKTPVVLPHEERWHIPCLLVRSQLKQKACEGSHPNENNAFSGKWILHRRWTEQVCSLVGAHGLCFSRDSGEGSSPLVYKWPFPPASHYSTGRSYFPGCYKMYHFFLVPPVAGEPAESPQNVANFNSWCSVWQCNGSRCASVMSFRLGTIRCWTNANWQEWCFPSFW